jgi:hypothetical protein
VLAQELVPPPSGMLPPLTRAWPPTWGCASITITDEPASLAAMAAGRPHAPDPMMTTSASRCHWVGACCACAEAADVSPPAPTTAAVPPRTNNSRRFMAMETLPLIF